MGFRVGSRRNGEGKDIICALGWILAFVPLGCSGGTYYFFPACLDGGFQLVWMEIFIRRIMFILIILLIIRYSMVWFHSFVIIKIITFWNHQFGVIPWFSFFFFVQLYHYLILNNSNLSFIFIKFYTNISGAFTIVLLSFTSIFEAFPSLIFSPNFQAIFWGLFLKSSYFFVLLCCLYRLEIY